MIPVIVTEPEYRKAAEIFSAAEGLRCIPAPSDEAGLANAVREHRARHVIIGVVRYTGALYDAIPSGGVIARFGVGHDGVDKAQAAARGILCCNTPGVLDDSVAECAIGLILALARHLAACSAELRGGTWTPRVGQELAGKTLAIIGYGNIGSRVARIASAGFGMRVVGFGVSAPADRGHLADFTQDFASAVAAADVVSIHIPDTPANRDYINRDRLARMRRTALLVNTARGGVLSEDDLYDAIAGGVIAGAALDVFKREPYQPADPARDLRTLPGVLMTPHVGSSTREACVRMAEAALRNIREAIAGRAGGMNLIRI